MKSLQQKWAAVHQLWTGKSTLPEVSDLASMTGGLNTPSKAMPAAKEAWTTIGELEQMPLEQVQPLVERARAYGNAGGRAVHPNDFPLQSGAGGMVPRPDVMDRVMNAGLRDKLLGFGQ
jgi:hypothetical protein